MNLLLYGTHNSFSCRGRLQLAQVARFSPAITKDWGKRGKSIGVSNHTLSENSPTP